MTLESKESEAAPCATRPPGTPIIRSRGDIARRRRPREFIGLGLTLGLLLSLGLWILSAWLYERSLFQARRLMDADHFFEARQWLLHAPLRWSKSPEAAYRLGVCEHAAGNIEAALAAWNRVDPHSSWAARAGLARARTLVGDLGRFSDGEAILVELLRDSGPQHDEIRHTLSELYLWEGRRDAIRRMIEQSWRSATDQKLELRDYWRSENPPVLLEKIRSEVDRAMRLAPEDDRVWLASASLAMQSGGFDEAASVLERCLKRRPDDPEIWRARLHLARAAENLVDVRRTLRHLQANLFTDAERLTLRAWLASRVGNVDAERRALEQLVLIVHDSWAMDRLALLAWNAGQFDQAREYRLRKAELDAAKDRYRLMMDGPLTPDRFVELAGLAESLGHRFEARGWWSLRARFAPSDLSATEALSRLGQLRESARLGHKVTLADALYDADPDMRAGTERPRPTRPEVAALIPRFTDDAQNAGLSFTFDNGATRIRQLPETTAGGVALLDYDGDGLLDVYVVQGGAFPPDPSRPNTGDRLFRNQGDGTFADATERSGIARMKRGYGHGIAVGDIDNDGHPDLVITRWRSYALYHNRGDGSFEEITDQAGLGGDRDWPTSAALADLDNDGDLDLYVCHYLVWDAEHPKLCQRKTVTAENERVERAQYNYCSPRFFPALPDHLFRNDGGRFVDVTAEAGILDQNGRGLGVVAADVDADGLIDLFVANDTTANYLWHNLGGMRFEEAGVCAGVACSADGAFQAGMGTACGDLDGDLRPDLFVTNFYGESTSFFRNLGSGVFGDQTNAIGLAAPSRFFLGFGVGLLDADNDGRLDLATANGHVNDDRPDYPYKMPAQLMMGGNDGRLHDVTQSAGEPWTIPRIGRGLCVGDLDDDGRMDVVLVPQGTPLVFCHNQTNLIGRAVSFLLEGTRSDRDGVGAVVTVKAGGRARRAWRLGGGSFLSASDPRLHFGLGEDRIDEVLVHWPSGQVDRFEHVEVDHAYRLREGAAAPIPLREFHRL